jgi:hypothetical protein
VVCIFCIAILAIVAGALTAASVDEVEEQLAEKADGELKRVSDTESVARFELTVDVDGTKAPVAVTLYKEHRRARIQILTHELTPEQVKRLQDELAEAIGATITERSDPQEEAEDPAHEHPDDDPERVAERVEASVADAERQAEPEPPRA